MQSKQEEEMEEMLKVLKSLEEVMRTTRSQGLFQTSQDTKHQALMVSSLGVGLSINCAVPYPSLRPPNVLGCIHPPPSHSTGATLRAVDAWEPPPWAAVPQTLYAEHSGKLLHG